MGTSLYGLTPAATYQGLIKFGDNSALTATQKVLSDGNGNNLPISVGTNSVTISGASTGATPITLTVDNTLGYTPPYDQVIQKWISGGVQRAIMFADGDLQSTYLTSNSTFTAKSNSSLRNTTIKGTGSTSATTSLIVQNNSLVNKIYCNDDSTTLNLLSGVAGTSPAQVTIGQITTGTFYLEAQTNGDVNGHRIYTDRQNTNMFFGCTSASTPTSYSITIGNSTNATGATHNIMFRQSNSVVGGFPNSANTTYPSAQFFIESTTRGFLPPRMTDAQVRAIVTPAVGLTCYNTDLDCPVFYSTLGWRKVSHSVM